MKVKYVKVRICRVSAFSSTAIASRLCDAALVRLSRDVVRWGSNLRRKAVKLQYIGELFPGRRRMCDSGHPITRKLEAWAWLSTLKTSAAAPLAPMEKR